MCNVFLVFLLAQLLVIVVLLIKSSFSIVFLGLTVLGSNASEAHDLWLADVAGGCGLSSCLLDYLRADLGHLVESEVRNVLIVLALEAD